MRIQANSLAEQVERVLRQRLYSGTYAAGSRMPSESELAAEFGVSRATVRTVLAKLAAQGLILRRQGDGTYVNERVQQAKAHLQNIWDFACLIENNGYSPSIRVISKEVREATEDESRALAIEPGAALLSMTRLFCADGKPVILAHNVFPLSLFRVPIEEVDGTRRIRDIVRHDCQHDIAFAITEIHATQPAEEAASLLERSASEPLLLLKVAFYSRENIPLALGENYFDDATLRLNLVQVWG
ncbi:MAG: GntR family transcriptional regulator [Chloroflexi bacterium]|nr:GntR family transcriptional regulator [Chloroflexota bacterium]